MLPALEHARDRTPSRYGTVVVYGAGAGGHTDVTRANIARQLAGLRGAQFSEQFETERRYARPVYFVPHATLLASDAARLGIHDEHDLFGGVVPFPFVGTKSLTHPLVAGAEFAPVGWAPLFGDLVREVVLPGITAFSAADARRAVARMLPDGAVRVKLPDGIGGRGQAVIDSVDALDPILARLGPEALATSGIVVEENLTDIATFSVGQVRVGHLATTYYGTQKLTRDNAGQEVYGGTDLVLANGGYDALLALDLPEPARHAVEQAQTYDAAARMCFPGFFASRRNYDVARGHNIYGDLRSGVLEQSWRIGGASGLEMAALEEFVLDPTLRAVRAAGFELYGDGHQPPPHATIHFAGRDETAGSLLKYTLVEEHVDAR